MSQCGTLIHGSREFGPSRESEITGEPLNSRSQILAPKWREITGVDCTRKDILYIETGPFIINLLFLVTNKTSECLYLNQ